MANAKLTVPRSVYPSTRGPERQCMIALWLVDDWALGVVAMDMAIDVGIVAKDAAMCVQTSVDTNGQRRCIAEDKVLLGIPTEWTAVVEVGMGRICPVSPEEAWWDAEL